VRWQFTGTVNVQDAQVVNGNHVLLAEYSARKVTERTFDGKIIWEKAFAGNGLPSGVRRLANGNTLIATRNQILEVDRAGRDVVTITRPQTDVYSAGKTRDGKYVMVSTQGLVIHLDAAGKELKSFRVQNISNFGNEILPNGHVIIPIQF